VLAAQVESCNTLDEAASVWTSDLGATIGRYQQ